MKQSINNFLKSSAFKKRKGLSNFFFKMKNGQDVCIAYLGGSITLAEGWRVKTFEWFQKKYPSCRMKQINAGIGGTGSDLGIFRLEDEVLQYDPDLIFVEFAANDTAVKPSDSSETETVYAAMEGIVRKIWLKNPSTDICFIYTVNTPMAECLRSGKPCWTADIMENIAVHYGIPSINVGIEIINQELAGKLVYRVERDSEEEKKIRETGKMIFSYDGVHPTLDDGHNIYTEIITSCISEMENSRNQFEHILKSPLSPNPWENVEIISPDNLNLSPEWETVTWEDEGFKFENSKKFKKYFKADKAGANIKFKFKGTGFGIYCVFGLNSGQLEISIDNDKPFKVPLFDRYGHKYRIHYSLLKTKLPDTEHSAIIRLDSEEPDRVKLLGKPLEDPEKYKGPLAYLIGLLLLGKLNAR